MITSNRQKWLVIAGIILSVFMASMEATVVATAMPTIASQLGGLEFYSWVFTAYLLTSTTLVPVFGKLSDIYGRRRVYMVAMVIFLLGSILCGTATTMNQLIIYRAIQGVGAGGVLPLAFIMIGEMFTLAERARFQGVFSGVWGVSSIVGPLLGGFIVDNASWHWVFLINVIPGVVAAALVWWNWRDVPRTGERKVAIDYAGAILLTVSVVALMLGLQWGSMFARIGLILSAVLLFALLLWVERRAADPILPITLFRERLFSVSVLQGLVSGVAMFGTLSFVPLFVQGVLGTSAQTAGLAMMPMMLMWVLGSIISSRLILTQDYKKVALVGMGFLVVGAGLLTFARANAQLPYIMLVLGMMGLGMGFSIPAFLIAVQSTVGRSQLGTATSMLQFSRSIGGTIGTGVMGAALSATLLSGLAAIGEGIDPSIVNELITGGEGGGAVAAIGSTAVRAALAAGVGNVFIIAFVAAIIGFGVTLLAPGGRIADLVRLRSLRMGENPEAAAGEPALATVEIH